MKKVNEILGEKPKKKAWLSKQMKQMFSNWALEAHKLDNSKSVSIYYEMFVTRLRDSYFTSAHKKQFFDEGIIEV